MFVILWEQGLPELELGWFQSIEKHLVLLMCVLAMLQISPSSQGAIVVIVGFSFDPILCFSVWNYVIVFCIDTIVCVDYCGVLWILEFIDFLWFLIDLDPSFS